MATNGKNSSIEDVWIMRPRIVAYLRKNGATHEDAEDLASETCLRAYSKWEMFDPARGQLEWWMLRIARNLFVSHLRKRRFIASAVGIDDLNEI